MRYRRVRRFGRGDLAALLVVLAAALGAAFLKDLLTERHDIRVGLAPDQLARRPAWLWALEWPFRRFTADVHAFLAVATIGIGTAPLRRPGLLRGRRGPSPGVAAGVVGSAAISWALAGACARVAAAGPWGPASPAASPAYWERLAIETCGAAEIAAAGAVLGAWAWLAVAGRWRPARGDWDDRLGRLVGWAWLASLAELPLYPILWM